MAQEPFYTSEDFERWIPAQTFSSKASSSEIRSPFQIDRDRIIFSYAFRRLQSKTQVFQSGDYDFYRTRLTHSIEVAKIGRSIVENLNAQSSSGVAIDADLVEAACLAHDLGHPPFGHIGERTLNECMAPWGGFEGNAQTLRILTELIFDRPSKPVGMQPSRALLDSILKYKKTFGSRIKTDAAGNKSYPNNHFVYDDQSDILHWVHRGGTLPERKCLECQVMDWADDTAYSLNDLSDGIQAGYVTPQKLEAWAAGQSTLSDDAQVQIEKLIDTINKQSYERRHAAKIGAFIRSASLVETGEDLPTPRYGLKVAVDEAIERECNLYKIIAVDLIFKSPQVQQNEYRGRYLLKRLFEALEETYIESGKSGLRILPDHWDQRVRETNEKAARYRIMCDALSSFTDGEAIRLYQRLFRADYGSLSDMV